MTNKKELINIADRPWSYNDIEYWKNPKDKCINAVITFNEKRSRLRAGILIIKDDEILLGEEEGMPGEFNLPGGGLDENETPVDAAKREAQEEVFINVKNARDTEYDYCECYDTVKKWVKDNVPEKKWWYNYYTCLVVAEYDSDYMGNVDKVDLDKAMKTTSRWYKIEDVINRPTFKAQWKKALIDFGYYKAPLIESSNKLIKYISTVPHRGATYITPIGAYIWAKGEDHPGLLNLLDLDMDEEEIIDAKGWIRCDSGLSYAGDAPASFIELPVKPITEAQYSALKIWMETCCTGDIFQISVTDGAYQDYDMDYYNPTYILNRIKHFYTQGILIEDLKDDAKKYFGTTYDWKLAIYLNTDGTLLDGSGKALGSGGWSRAVDHREVADVFDNTISGDDAMLAYMREGNIRLKPEAPGFEIMIEPNKLQYKILYNLMLKYEADYYVDIVDSHGFNLQAFEYQDARDEVGKTIQDIKAYFHPDMINESVQLQEASRTKLIGDSRNKGNYTGDTSRGKNRFERKKYSKVANYVKQYNNLDMNDFFKKDILLVKVPVTGESDNYTVSIKMEGVCTEIARNIKSNNNKLEFRTIIQALTKIFNSNDIYVNCTCDDYKYRFAHWNIVNNVSTDDTAHDPGPGKGIRNPNDDKGRGCKHILLVLNNGDWLIKVASVLNNYIHYAEEHMQKPFLNVIFPKLYGVPAKEMVAENIINDDKYLDSSTGLIDAINEYGKTRGRYTAGTNKNPVTGTGGRTKKVDTPAANVAQEPQTEKK